MVPIDTPRKRIAILLIALTVVSFHAGLADAATKTIKKSVSSKVTTTKKVSKVKGESISAGKVSVIGNNTITTYTVKSGDTLGGIAQKFDITANTLRWSNDISSSDKIHQGQKLVILPTSGIIYTVKSGDTLGGIALKFNADQQDILNANDLKDADSLKTGMTLVVPDAEPLDLTTSPSSTSTTSTPAPAPVVPTPVTPSSTQTAAAAPVVIQSPGTTMVVTNPVTAVTYAITVTPATTSTMYQTPSDDIRGYYAQPIAGRLSQGIHAVNAVDIAAPIGTTVHAAANGTVIVAMGNGNYNGGYGDYIVISHPNGTQTLYAHLSQVDVTLGETVLQGEPIALSGNSGETTGPHLHFEVRGAVNPWGADKLGTIYSI